MESKPDRLLASPCREPVSAFFDPGSDPQDSSSGQRMMFAHLHILRRSIGHQHRALAWRIAALLGAIASTQLQAGEGYLSRVGPPPMRLSSPSASLATPLPNPRTQPAPSEAASTKPVPPPAAEGKEKPESSATTPVAENHPPEPYGPPPPPVSSAKEPSVPPETKPSQEPPTTHPVPAKSDPAPVVEFRAASDAVGIRSFDPAARIGITPQMLVRFFKRRPDQATIEGTPSSPPESLTEILVPVEFVPPQPLTSPPSSSATYQLVPKP